MNSYVTLETIMNFTAKHHFCISKKGQNYILYSQLDYNLIYI